ncbi:MAG: hypothetical protein AAGI53_12585 [Planctomycetota bacterium]
MRRAILLVLLVLVGCGSTPEAAAPVPRVEVDPAAIREAWAKRTERLERLWARVTVVVDTVDEEGKPVKEQAEGHLQIEQPRGVSLTLGKLGENYLYLGSNDERYWWIDRVDSDRRYAVTGLHELITSRKAEALGVPVHPLELIEFMGIKPLPEDAEFVPGAEPGTIEVVRSLATGSLTWVLDAVTATPNRVVVKAPDGSVSISARHEAYQFARVRDDLRIRPRVPGRVVVEVPELSARVRIALYDPENKPIRSVAFDYDRLIRGLKIDQVRDLDAASSDAGNTEGYLP